MTTHKTAGRMGKNASAYLKRTACGSLQSPIPAEDSVTTTKAINRSTTASTSVPAVIGAFKSITTKTVNQNNRTPGEKLWQSGCWDDKIRSKNDYAEIHRYIDENPFKWAEDRYFTRP